MFSQTLPERGHEAITVIWFASQCFCGWFNDIACAPLKQLLVAHGTVFFLSRYHGQSGGICRKFLVHVNLSWLGSAPLTVTGSALRWLLDNSLYKIYKEYTNKLALPHRHTHTCWKSEVNTSSEGCGYWLGTCCVFCNKPVCEKHWKEVKWVRSIKC